MPAGFWRLLVFGFRKGYNIVVAVVLFPEKTV